MFLFSPLEVLCNIDVQVCVLFWVFLDTEIRRVHALHKNIQPLQHIVEKCGKGIPFSIVLPSQYHFTMSVWVFFLTLPGPHWSISLSYPQSKAVSHQGFEIRLHTRRWGD